MPYSCVLQGSRWKLLKKSGGEPLGTHETKRQCVQQMRAVYANESKRPENIIYNGYIFDEGMIDTKIAESKDEVNVWINSKGGDFLEGMSIHNKLRNAGKRVITHIDPFAISAGAIVALAGDEVCMVENGALMFHAPKLASNQAKTAEELAQDSATMKKHEDILVNTLMSKTKKTDAECRTLISKDTWFTAEEALNFGIVDTIIPIYREVQVENFFPDRILNFLKEKRDMPLKEVCQRLGIEESEDVLVALVESLRKSQPKPPQEMSEQFLNMFKDARTVQLDALVSNGKATPAVVTKLKTKYLDPNRLKQDAATSTSEFDTIVATLNENETIINFGGSTGTQQLNDKNKEGDKKSSLSENARKRREAAKAAS